MNSKNQVNKSCVIVSSLNCGLQVMAWVPRATIKGEDEIVRNTDQQTNMKMCSF